jgi:alginate O-acetyltransferase complex protein AlgI
MVGYFLTPRPCKNAVLFIFSLIFYFVGEPVFVFLLLVSIGIDYFHSKVIERHFQQKKAKIALVSSILLNVGLLSFFKYSDFIINNLNSMFSLSIPLLNIPLPIGISFFTFQTMSYTIDVYRGEAKAQKSFLNIGTYIALFPQLIAGPIVKYKTISKELTERKHNFENAYVGLSRFIVGLAKKVILANSFGLLANKIDITTDPSVLYYWMTSLAYMLQIYYDFSGYSDMAIGLGKFLGFNFLENFNYPYISKSITEFWRRWHISLGQWFRDYAYIPLGGNRAGKFRTYINIFVVWGLTGLWHGASWNFVLWGLFFALILSIEKTFIQNKNNSIPNMLGHAYTLFIVLLSFVLFRYESLGTVLVTYKSMFGITNIPITSYESIYYLKSYFVLFAIGIIGATPLVKNYFSKLLNNMKGKKLINVLEPAYLIFVFLLSTSYLVDGSFNPFLYFRF